MMLSELLAEAKRKEGELLRLYDRRYSMMSKKFEKDYPNETSVIEREKLKSKFDEDQIKKVKELNEEINSLLEELVELKTSIAEANVKIGQSSNLLRMKYLKLDLSKSMEASKESRYDYNHIDKTVVFGIDERITKAEKIKTKLESDIQKLNWSTEV